MSKPLAAAALGALVLVTVPGGEARAQGTVSKCAAAKKKCVAKKVTGLLACHVRAEASGLPLDGFCINKAEVKFDGGPNPGKSCFEKYEARGGCLTTDDTAAVEVKVDAFIDDLVTTLDPGYPTPVLNGCAAAKKKCAAKKVKGLLGWCYAKFETTGVIDPGCLDKIRAKFDGGPDPSRSCFARLEAKGNCLTSADTAPVEQKIDAFVCDVVTELDLGAVPPTCVPTTTTTSTTAP